MIIYHGRISPSKGNLLQCAVQKQRHLWNLNGHFPFFSLLENSARKGWERFSGFRFDFENFFFSNGYGESYHAWCWMGHDPTRCNVLKLERYAQESRTSMYMPLEIRFEILGPWRRWAHGLTRATIHDFLFQVRHKMQFKKINSHISATSILLMS
jgi:hypothetical protein